MNRLKFQKVQRAVIQRARQPETVFDQNRFARTVAFRHAADLRHADVRFIQHEEKVVREKINHRRGPRAGRAVGDVPGIILDAGTEAHLLHHFQIVFRPHLDALGFEQLAVFLEMHDAFAQFFADGQRGAFHFVAGGDELFRRKNHRVGGRFQLVACERIEARDAFDLLAEEFDAQGVLAAGGAEFNRVAAHAKLAALEGDVVAVVLQIHKAGKKLLARQRLADMHRDDHRLVIVLAARAVDARHACHHDHVAPRKEAAHGREPQPLDLLIDGGILLDERVGARDVGLGLVVIEIADEVFDGVVGEETFELRVELGCKRLVVRDDERGFVDVPDDVGNGERLARTRDAEQRLMFRAREHAFGQLGNGLRLIAGGLVIGDKFKHFARTFPFTPPSRP